MNYAQRELFFINLKQQFSDIFQASKADKDNTELRLRTQGFIHAGELLALCSRADVQQLIIQKSQFIYFCCANYIYLHAYLFCFFGH